MADDVTDPKTGQLIYPGFQRGPGLHNATSYQVSAIPFLTGNLQAPGFDGGAGSPIAPATEPSRTSRQLFRIRFSRIRFFWWTI